MSNSLSFLLCNFFWLLLAAFLGFLLGLLFGWLFFRGKKIDGDLSIEGEGALRAEADSLRGRVQELEGNVSRRDTEISGLKGKLAAGAAGAVAATALAATANGSPSKTDDSEDTYALEWRNRYLAARVKYLEGQVAEAPKKAAPKKKTAPKKAKVVGAAALAGAAVAAKPKTKVKPKVAKAKAKAAPKPKVLYTDGPTDGTPDDLKVIKGIGPKFEGDLNAKGIYYFRQIGAWQKKDVKMVEGVIDSIPGRIERDEWVKQAKGLANSPTGAKAASSKSRSKPGPKPGTKRGELTASGQRRQKPGPKSGSTRTSAKSSEADAAFDKYFANVVKYHPKARKPVVKGIVKHCGIALRTRDGSLIACSDEAELKTVADGFVTKKLGKTEGQMDLVKEVCEDMKGERFKSRVTFYYLAARKARKLGQFS